MITVAICDDQEVYLKWLKSEIVCCLEEVGFKDVEVLGFGNPHVFLDSLNSIGGVDVAVLDICMPGMSGTELANEIRARRDSTAIIFISSSKDYAVEAFALNAAHYITKPFRKSELKEALERAIQPIIVSASKKIMINLGNGVYRNIDITSIDYIESVGYRRVIHCGSEVLNEIRKSLSDILNELEVLSPGQFFRLHRWCLINLDAIKSISVERVQIRTGEELPMRSGVFRLLRESFFDWSFREKNEK